MLKWGNPCQVALDSPTGVPPPQHIKIAVLPLTTAPRLQDNLLHHHVYTILPALLMMGFLLLFSPVFNHTQCQLALLPSAYLATPESESGQNHPNLQFLPVAPSMTWSTHALYEGISFENVQSIHRFTGNKENHILLLSYATLLLGVLSEREYCLSSARTHTHACLQHM